VIDIHFIAAPVIHPLKDDRCISSIEIVIFEIDPYVSMPGEVRSAEAVDGKRAVV